MPKEITFYVILGEKRDPSEICANPNLRNQTHIPEKPSYVYTRSKKSQLGPSMIGILAYVYVRGEDIIQY